MLTKIMYLLDLFVWMVNLLANPELNEPSGAPETSSENIFCIRELLSSITFQHIY
jgi:hypothetical protein